MGKVSMSHEDYLEAIVMLGGSDTQSVRSVDVATKLGVSKASVSKAVASLKASGMLDQPYYGDITLTADGYSYGKSVLERHEMLTRGRRRRSMPDGACYQRRIFWQMA